MFIESDKIECALFAILYAKMEEWKCFKTILHECINYKGTVYGGAVRDMMLHKMHAREFKKKHSMDEYERLDVSPETIGRLVIPKNIDCLISDNNFTKLLKHLKILYDVSVDDVSGVYCEKYTQKFKRISLTILMKECIYVDVYLDVQHTGQKQLPCRILDFDVNGLMISLNGTDVNGQLLRTYDDAAKNEIQRTDVLSDVLDNIRHKRAIMIGVCPVKRYIKMSKYGWDIPFVAKVFNYYINVLYEGECIICNEKIPEDMCCVNYKKCRCDLRICLNCALSNHKLLNKCPLCREICYDLTDAINELCILRMKYL